MARVAATAVAAAAMAAAASTAAAGDKDSFFGHEEHN
jgi:hypothetical protein